MIQISEYIKLISHQLSKTIAHINNRAENANQKCDILQQYFDQNLVINKETNSRQSQNINIATEFGNTDNTSPDIKEFNFLFGSKLRYQRVIPSSSTDGTEVVNYQTLMDYVNRSVSSSDIDLSQYLKTTGTNKANASYTFNGTSNNLITFNIKTVFNERAIFNNYVTFGSPNGIIDFYTPITIHNTAQCLTAPVNDNDLVRKKDITSLASPSSAAASYYTWSGSSNDLSSGTSTQSNFLSYFFNLSTDHQSLICLAPCAAIISIIKNNTNQYLTIKSFAINDLLTPNSILTIDAATIISIGILGAVSLPGTTITPGINPIITLLSQYTIPYDSSETVTYDTGTYTGYTALAENHQIPLTISSLPPNANVVWSCNLIYGDTGPHANNIYCSISGSTLSIAYAPMTWMESASWGRHLANATEAMWRITAKITASGYDEIIVTKDITFSPSFA